MLAPEARSTSACSVSSAVAVGTVGLALSSVVAPTERERSWRG